MIIQHNAAALFNQRQLGIQENERAGSVEKLASGYRVNRAADDAAGLKISEKCVVRFAVWIVLRRILRMVSV